jgi:hypothetical protein
LAPQWDADGVALAAILGLNHKVETQQAALCAELQAKDSEIQTLKSKVAEVDELRKRLAELERLLAPRK